MLSLKTSPTTLMQHLKNCAILGGVSQKVLTTQLRELEADGVVERTVYPEVPPRVEYALTELGRDLVPVLEGLHAWGEKKDSEG